MHPLDPLTEALAAGRDLSPKEAAQAARALAASETPAEAKKTFLAALHDKGETADEMAAFAAVFRELTAPAHLEAWAPRAIDVVGTGGDGANAFNISCATCFLLAAGGQPVIKHGNRAATSTSGSADLLQRFGVPLESTAAQRQAWLEKAAFTFLFAPAFHPAFKEIVPVRKELAAEGKRTLFNLLGPLLNPARPAFALIGVFADEWVTRVAAALDQLGVEAGLVVHGRLGEGKGVDKLHTCGETRVVGCGRLRHLNTVWKPDEFGFDPAPVADLVGGTAEENEATLKAIFAGGGPRGLRETIIFNAGIGFYITGAEANPQAGITRAQNLLADGTATAWLERVQQDPPA